MRFIVLEGLYSTNGDYPDLKSISCLAKEHEACIIVDDAHGIGVLGHEGRGVLELFRAYNDIDLITGSFGKAIGTFGGFMAGKTAIIDFFRCQSPMYIYSTALPPAIAAATILSLRYIKDHPEIRSRIQDHARSLQKALGEMRFAMIASASPIISVTFKDPSMTIAATHKLFDKGIYAVPFIPPSVPRKSSRIRLTINAHITSKDIDQVIRAFKEIAKENPQWLADASI